MVQRITKQLGESTHCSNQGHGYLPQSRHYYLFSMSSIAIVAARREEVLPHLPLEKVSQNSRSGEPAYVSPVKGC